MALTVWKYRQNVGEVAKHDMPKGASLTLVLVDADDPTVVSSWWLVDPLADRIARHFTTIGTGHQVFGSARFIGSARHDGTGLVWHLIEMFPKEDDR